MDSWFGVWVLSRSFQCHNFHHHLKVLRIVARATRIVFVLATSYGQYEGVLPKANYEDFSEDSCCSFQNPFFCGVSHNVAIPEGPYTILLWN